MKHYKLVICGGTAFAVGLAVALAKQDINVCIFDRGSLVGAEFAVAFKGSPMMHYEPVTDMGKLFKSELTKRGIMGQSGDSYAALEPVFCKMLAEYHDKIDFIACASPILCEYGNNVHKLELSTIGGVCGIECGTLIDTTSSGRIIAKALNAMLKLDKIPQRSDFDITAGRFDDECYIHMPVECDYTQARMLLFNKWINRGAELSNAELLYIADRFEETCDNTLLKEGESEYSIPSVGFSSALEAFDFGVAFADKLGGTLI